MAKSDARAAREWSLYWTGCGQQVPCRLVPLLSGWADLDQREEAADIGARHPILIDPESRIDPVLARFLARARDGAQAAAARVDAAKSGLDGLWDRTNPGRRLVELVLAPFDIVAADHWIDLLKEMAGQPREWLKELDQEIMGIKKLMASGQDATEELIGAGGKAERTGAMTDAFEAFAPGWLKAAAGSMAEIRGLSCALTGAGPGGGRQRLDLAAEHRGDGDHRPYRGGIQCGGDAPA